MSSRSKVAQLVREIWRAEVVVIPEHSKPRSPRVAYDFPIRRLHRAPTHLVYDACAGFARHARFKRHLRRMTAVIEKLEASGRDDATVLAILTVESFYRPRALRLLEYLGWLGLTMLRHDRARMISVGRGQLQLVHWRSLGLIESHRFSIERWAKVRDVRANYDACRRYLNRHGMLAERDTSVLTSVYTGASNRPTYAAMLAEARSTIGAGLTSSHRL